MMLWIEGGAGDGYCGHGRSAYGPHAALRWEQLHMKRHDRRWTCGWVWRLPYFASWALKGNDPGVGSTESTKTIPEL